MEAVGLGCSGRADRKWNILCHCLGEQIWLPLVGPKLEVGTKGSCWSFIKSWAFWTECYRVIIWLSIVTRDSRLVPVNKRLALWAVAADGEGWWSKLYFYI